MKRIPMLVVMVAATAATTLAQAATARADAAPSCAAGQVVVSNGGHREAVGHREVIVTFSLATGETPCTLTGYPGVDSGAGGPLLHAERTPSGFLGGLPEGVLVPPTVTLYAWRPALAVVEGVAVDPNDIEHKCPTYTELRVTPPDTTDTVTIATKDFDTCELWVHPVGSLG